MARRIGRCSTMPALRHQESRHGLPDDLACRDAPRCCVSTQTAREAFRHFERDRNRVLGRQWGRTRSRQFEVAIGLSSRQAKRARKSHGGLRHADLVREQAPRRSQSFGLALASNESSDTCVLPFASQINHTLSTPAHNRPFEAEVIFCVQGASSPLLANIYLHYTLDLWATRWRRREATGDMIYVRYADDFIVGLQHESDARRFLDEMRERLREFALSLHPEKTRLIEVGRFAPSRRQRRGLGKPETFSFLGFTFICGKTRAGKFQIKRRTRADRMRAKLKMIKEEMWRRMHQPIPEQGKWLGRVVPGYFNYHPVPTNAHALHVFRHHVTALWRRTFR